MPASKLPDGHATTQAPGPDVTLAAIVSNHVASRGLTAAGIAATTFLDILEQPIDVVAGYLDGEPAQLYVRPGDAQRAEAVAEKLTRVGVPVSVITEIDDRERLS